MRLSWRMWLWSQYCRPWQTHQPGAGTRGHPCRFGICNGTNHPRRRRTTTTTSTIGTIVALVLFFMGQSPLLVRAWCCGSNGDYSPSHYHHRRASSRWITTTTLYGSGSSSTSSGGGGGENHPHHPDGEESVRYFGGEPGVVLRDLTWRVEKLRLEEQNQQRFLKAMPRFLPYVECRKWVQAFGRRWKTEQDWREWIAMGEKRNSYIPVRMRSMMDGMQRSLVYSLTGHTPISTRANLMNIMAGLDNGSVGIIFCWTTTAIHGNRR
jgi:hypothetical protein